MHWILMVYIAGYGRQVAPAMGSAEFNTLAACHSAYDNFRNVANSAFNPPNSIKAVCVPKG